MSTHICPVCGDETIEMGTFSDGDGDGPYTRSWVDAELTRQDCSCHLTEEQEDALILAAVKAAYEYEP